MKTNKKISADEQALQEELLKRIKQLPDEGSSGPSNLLDLDEDPLYLSPEQEAKKYAQILASTKREKDE